MTITTQANSITDEEKKAIKAQLVKLISDDGSIELSKGEVTHLTLKQVDEKLDEWAQGLLRAISSGPTLDDRFRALALIVHQAAHERS